MACLPFSTTFPRHRVRWPVVHGDRPAVGASVRSSPVQPVRMVRTPPPVNVTAQVVGYAPGLGSCITRED